jgi:pimeloyl-ACP methyl ester carboxylesterase
MNSSKTFVCWLARVSRLCIWATFCLYICFSPVVARPLYDLLLWRGVPYPYGSYHQQFVATIKREEAFIPLNVLPNSPFIHAWFFKMPGARRVILLHHGQGSNLSMFLGEVWEYLQMGHSVLIYDYEGHGRSSGTPTILGICRDGEAAYNWLVQEKGYRPDQIVHVGDSLGSGVAAEVAVRHPCAGLVMFAPYASLMEVAHYRLPILDMYPQWLIGYPDIGALKPLSKKHPPVLMMSGVKDPCIPVTQGDKIARVADKEGFTYVRFSDCGHADFFAVENAATLKAIRQFMERLP